MVIHGVMIHGYPRVMIHGYPGGYGGYSPTPIRGLWGILPHPNKGVMGDTPPDTPPGVTPPGETPPTDLERCHTKPAQRALHDPPAQTRPA